MAEEYVLRTYSSHPIITEKKSQKQTNVPSPSSSGNSYVNDEFNLDSYYNSYTNTDPDINTNTDIDTDTVMILILIL